MGACIWLDGNLSTYNETIHSTPRDYEILSEMESYSLAREEAKSLNQYPRTYRIRDDVRRAGDAIGLAPLALITALCVLEQVSRLINVALVRVAVTPFQLIVFVAFATVYAILFSSLARRRVVLYEDGIAVLGVFSTRKLKRSEIRGWRMVPSHLRAASCYIIVPADSAARELRLPPSLDVDKDFFSWMNEIPKKE